VENKPKTGGPRLVLCVIFIALALRAPLTGVGPLVGQIQADLELSAFLAGIITTIPLLAFALVSPAAPGISGRLGTGRTLIIAFLLAVFGLVLRSFGGVIGLYAGTLLIGVGIAFGNVLLPAVIKAKFPNRIQTMTGLYTTIMTISAGTSSAISVPLALYAGWQKALAVWVLLMLLTLLFLLPNRSLCLENNQPADKKNKSLLHSPLALWVAVYMGLQSLIFYCCVAWLPSILAAKGYSEAAAGYFSSMYQLFGMPASFFVAFFARLRPDQKVLTTMISAFYLLALLLVLVLDAGPLLVVALAVAGFASGACLSLAMLFIGLRTESAADAARLSGMSQSLGYLIAAIGPACLGIIYDHSHSWSYPLIVLLVLILAMIIAGLKAAANRKI
jgi:CP family cyanate transporter-like MFS transporter